MRPSSRAALALGGVAAIALAVAVWKWPSPAERPPGAAAPAPVAAPPPVDGNVAEAPRGQASSAPTTVEPPPDTSPIEAAGIAAALEKLMGRKAVLTFMQLDDFPRRVVATVDNLARDSAPSRLWPVYPAEGRFTVMQQDGATVISPDNGLRYTPLVLLVETLNIDHAADLYSRMYPLLQQAYEELGYPGRSFNDRLLEVIDLLLATPQPDGPVKLDLLEIKGPMPSERPWVHYRFADPALESLAAGQKMLIRTGPVNERRLKGKLLEFRQGIAERSRTR